MDPDIWPLTEELLSVDDCVRRKSHFSLEEETIGSLFMSEWMTAKCMDK